MKSKTATAADILDAVIRSRKSVRAFRSEPVPRRLLMEIVETARAAPSNFNSQPWRVYLLAGKAKHALGEAIMRAYHFYRNANIPLPVRMRAAISCLPFETPKLAVTGIVEADGDFAAILDRRIKRLQEAKLIEHQPPQASGG